MTQPRKAQVSLDDTPWYHLVNRCVRRAFLCGRHGDQDYSHRKPWIEARIRQLASVFAIDVAAYAVMSNHYHVVVRVDRPRAQAWTNREVLERWTQLFRGPLLVQRFLADDRLGEGELMRIGELADSYRQRLYDLSWYMRVLNESIARMANAEDHVTGRFWEGRFKSQALLDEQAILTVMSYVDLNPIRAGIATTPEESDHTSLQARLQDRADQQPAPIPPPEAQTACQAEERSPFVPAMAQQTLPQAPLMPFDATGRTDQAITFAYTDYLEWVDWIGRAILPHKRGSIPGQLPALAERLGVDPRKLADHARGLLERFGHAIGQPARLRAYSHTHERRHLRGTGQGKGLFHPVQVA